MKALPSVDRLCEVGAYSIREVSEGTEAAEARNAGIEVRGRTLTCASVVERLDLAAPRCSLPPLRRIFAGAVRVTRP